MINVFLQGGERWKDRHWCCNCPGFLWVTSIEGIFCGHCFVAHILQIDSVLGASLAVLGFPDYSLWKASLSSTCVQPAKTISTTLLLDKKYFTVALDLWAPVITLFMKKNAPITDKESFHYHLYVAHTCVQPENAISPAVWPTNIIPVISLGVSPNKKSSVTVNVQFCFSFSF